MICSVPKKIIGTLLCAAALWTTFTQGTSLKIDLKHETITDPHYKRYLKLMGSWFMGDQVGEVPVGKGVGGSEMTVAQHLYTLLPILKRSEALSKKPNNSFDKNLANQAKTIENALAIHETIDELVKPGLDPDVKTAKITELNDKIFKKVENDETVLIPVSWKNTKPGSMLISISKENEEGVLRVYDTLYTFSSNAMIKDGKEEYPQRIIPWREIHFKLDKIKRYKILVLGLIILKDDSQLDLFYLEKENKSWLISLFSAAFIPTDAREHSDIGRIYLYRFFFPVFGAFENPNVSTVDSWPLNTLKMGPVNDILAYFMQTANKYEKYQSWRLETGYSMLKLFLKRFSSDSDIHQETRSRTVVGEILKRSANRLLRDAFELTRIQEWIPAQIGEADNNFWKYLHTSAHKNRDMIDTYLKRVIEITKYNAYKSLDEKQKLIEMMKLFEKNYNEIFEGKAWDDVKGAISTKIDDLLKFDGNKKPNDLENAKNNKLKEIDIKRKELFKAFKEDPKNKDASEEQFVKESKRIEKDPSLKALSDEYEELKKNFDAAIEERQKIVDGLIEDAKALASKAVFKLKDSAANEAKNQAKLELIKAVMKLREEIFNWIKEKNLDVRKLSKLTRSLEQREVPLKQNIYVMFHTTIEEPVDLTEYNPAGSSDADFSNCMSGIDIKIKSLKEFIQAFSNMKKVWHWKVFGYEVPFPHCKPFFRRNAELLLKNLQLGGFDKESIDLWTPVSQKEYKEFHSLSVIILNMISTLSNGERTLEDYLIIMRLQRVAWRVAQALDAKFAAIEPQRHLDLIQYSLSYPQCHRLLKNQMSYNNYFLADSGAFGNILDYNSVTEMKDLCQSLVEEEKFGKPILDHEKYLETAPFFVSAGFFDKINSGDREIYFKMAQNPQIAQTVRENFPKYDFGEESFVGNAARAVSLGQVGSQFIYYQFFDAVKIVLVSNLSFEKQVTVDLPIKLTYVPVTNLGSGLVVFTSKEESSTVFTTVNEELIKKHSKSYLKTSITEMITSHILGLDVIVNHIGRGSPKFWSSGNVLDRKKENSSFFGRFKIIQSIINLVDQIIQLLTTFMVPKPPLQKNRFKLKAYRRDIAGSADFFLNCSAHLLRKIDVAPGYEELVMTLLLNAFSSVHDELEEFLKDAEKQDIPEEDEKEKKTVEEKDRVMIFNENARKEEEQKRNNAEETKKNQNYLGKGKTTSDERLKSLINWATIAVRFAARVRTIKPEWKDRYADIPKHFYSTMIKYSRAQKGDNRRFAHLSKNFVAHTDYLLFMICAMNMNDPNLRLEVYTNLKPDDEDKVNFPQDSSVLPAAMVLHRLLALSQYEYDVNGPLTEEFIDNQFAIEKVMKAISNLAEQNESFLSLMAVYMKPFLNQSPKFILEEYTQGDNIAQGVLTYGTFSLNLIQGTFTQNGSKARDPNSILRYALFREFFASGNAQVVPTLGRDTYGCPNRYEIENFLVKGSKYSICEDIENKRITIYRKIDDFRKPCLLVRRKRIINALQRAFSIYTNEGVDLYHCVRGNNAHFVWIDRKLESPAYISHGRLTQFFDVFVELFFNDKVEEILENLGKNDDIEDFELEKQTKIVDKEPSWREFLFLPRVNFPKIEIRDVDKTPLFPLTAESKLMVVPEPMIRFSGGNQFGTYMLNNKLVFMFQQFRFRDRPEVSLTFAESADGNLEMKGREDLKVCEDQIFENNFWPALMLTKTGESGEAEKKRFAYVPIANSEMKLPDGSKFHEDISCKYDPESNLSDSTCKLNSSLIFMEEYPVEKYQIGESKNVDGTIKKIYAYKLNPTSRLQRILLAFHNLRLRNYDTCLKLLDPRSEIDHNTPLSDDEIKILNWMVKLRSAQEPEAYALRLMANIHLILDAEIFPPELDPKAGGSSENAAIEDISDKVFTDDNSLLEIYNGKAAIPDSADFSENILMYDSKVDNNLDGDTKIGRYFAFLPLLPKRFHIDQVFREAMASYKVQKFLKLQYEQGIKYPVRNPDPEKSIFFEFKKCDFSDYLSDLRMGLLKKPILQPLSASDEEKLKKHVENRLVIPYAAHNCDLVRMLIQKFLQIHDKNQDIPKDLQELAVLTYYLSGMIPDALVDGYLYILSNPDFLNSITIGKMREMINLKAFEKEWVPITENGEQVDPPKTLLTELMNLATSIPLRGPGSIIYGDGKKEMTPSDKILGRILPKAPNAEDAIKEREINSIKFMSEDLHYIRITDREVYQETIDNINKARSSKSAAIIPQLAELNEESKTKKGLEIAIKDYLEKRIEPIDFDKLEKNLFKKLKVNIKDRVKVFAANMKKLEAQYARFYAGTANSQTVHVHKEKIGLQAPNVLSSLKRIFNNDKIPALKDLRDCFMQLSRSCLRNRLPEMPESSIVKIAQLLKSYYIQKIIFNNLNAINEKVKTFDELVIKAAEAQDKLDESPDDSDTRDIEDEIFDHKDTALLSVEDIYVDMEKLLKLEQRLKDPVTLNFEFMSAKFHLTKVQVMDIASLASRTWEEELKKDVIERYIDENIKGIAASKKIAKNSKLYQVSEKFKQLVGKYYPDEKDLNKPALASTKLGTLQELKTLASSAKPADTETLQEKLTEIWSYMPRDERRINQADFKAAQDKLYQERPVLERLKPVGELQPYDPSKDGYFSRVIQRKMAAGKTTVLGTAATAKKADGKTLSVLVILSALYQSSAPDMQKRTSEFFNTRGFAFAMPKPRLTIPKPGQRNHPAKSFLLWTLKTLITTINSNSYLVVTPETLQSFLNSYVEFLDAFISVPGGRLNPELSQCLQLFATIYDIFRSRGSVILDEIDSSMRPQKELNFPTNKREGILLSGVELTSDLLLHSALNNEINTAGLNLLANQQAALNNDQYDEVNKLWRKYITHQLNDKSSIWYKTFFPQNQDPVATPEELIKFFFEPSPLDTTAVGNGAKTAEIEAEIDRLAAIKLKSERVFHVMMIVKMQLKNWLKNCFKGSVNEHYGPSMNQSGQKALYYAIPYMAANTPAEGSIFADRWETVNKTFMMYLVKNLTIEDLSMILLDLRTLSQGNAQSIDVKAEFKAACPDFELLNLKFNAQNRLAGNSEKIMKCMKSRSPSALKLIFYWVTKSVFETQQFYAEQITSNAINLTTMFPSVQGYSGTIDNVNILPHQVMIEAEIDHRKNEQANGAIAMKLLNQKNCVTTVQKIENITQIDKLLDAMCRDIKDLSVFSAFIDAGALLKDFTNAEVAFALGRKFKRDIILFYDEKTNQLSFHDPKNGPQHVTALESSETKYLNLTTHSSVKNRFTYYDQRHITGSDILQPPTAKAFLTIGPKVLLRDILQGVMRMRQFQSGQSIHFVTTSAVETLLSKFSRTVRGVTSDGSPRVDQSHLITLGALNEDEKQLNENVRLYRVKIDAEIRAFVLDRITEALAKTDTYSERVSKAPPLSPDRKLTFGFNHERLFEVTRSLFIRNVKENPVNWASINVLTDAKVAVEKYKDERIKMIPDLWKTDPAYQPKWNIVNANLNSLTEEITDKDREDETKLVKKARSVLCYLNKTLEVSEINAKFTTPSSEKVELGSTIEMELQLELQQELELELEQQILDGKNEHPLPEPVLNISLESDQTGSVLSAVPGLELSPAVVKRANQFVALDNINGLLTPWKLEKTFTKSRADFNDALKELFRTDIFCPGMAQDEKNLADYCKKIPGFVGLSNGLAKVTKSDEIDFITMSSREGTHLLFWRGRTDSSNPDDYKYAVFLISGSEAHSLHENWQYSSCSIGPLDSFWLTDLYGFEVHGTPFASTALSSNKFSLLETIYEKHFIDLHFRALVLNGSYNVVMTSKALYDRMRAWLGDFEMIKKLDPTCKNGIKREIIEKRVSFFLNRLGWMSKLRDEIVPDDPFIKDILKIYANQPVEFEETADKYKEVLNRGQTETHSNKVKRLIDSDDPEAQPWKPAKNVNKSEHFAFFNWIILIFIILVLVGIIFVWGRSVGINWPEFFKTKWFCLIALFKKSAETAIESVDPDEPVKEDSEQVVPTEPTAEQEVTTEPVAEQDVTTESTAETSDETADEN